jgi:REP element-mobilizing transposase RayT
MSRTALDGFPFGDAKKEYLVSLLNRLRKFYFAEILGFCCMLNHLHLLARMLPEADFTDKEIKKDTRSVMGKTGILQKARSPFSGRSGPACPNL